MSNMKMMWMGVSPSKLILAQITDFVISALLVVIILIIGWIISGLIRSAVTKILKVAKIDDFSRRIELDDILIKGGVTSSLSGLVAGVCYGLCLMVTFVVAFNAVGLTVAADLIQRIVLFVPNIISALFILIIGFFVASVLKNIVRTAATNAKVMHASILSNVTEVVVIVFAVAIALEQVHVGARIVELTISIILGSIGLGFALAFGLGCKDLVGKGVADFLNKLKK